jgi:hypothetical protein
MLVLIYEAYDVTQPQPRLLPDLLPDRAGAPITEQAVREISSEQAAREISSEQAAREISTEQAAKEISNERGAKQRGATSMREEEERGLIVDVCLVFNKSTKFFHSYIYIPKYAK